MLKTTFQASWLNARGERVHGDYHEGRRDKAIMEAPNGREAIGFELREANASAAEVRRQRSLPEPTPRGKRR